MLISGMRLSDLNKETIYLLTYLLTYLPLFKASLDDDKMHDSFFAQSPAGCSILSPAENNTQ